MTIIPQKRKKICKYWHNIPEANNRSPLLLLRPTSLSASFLPSLSLSLPLPLSLRVYGHRQKVFMLQCAHCAHRALVAKEVERLAASGFDIRDAV